MMSLICFIRRGLIVASFFVKALETASPYKSIDEKITYHVEEWIDLNNLIIKYGDFSE